MILHFTGHVTCQDRTAYVEFSLKADPDQLMQLFGNLDQLPEKMPPADTGVIHAEIDQPEAQPFSRQPDDKPFPEELLPHSGRAITRADLARGGSSAARWALLGQRYPWLFKQEEAVKPPATMKDIDRLARKTAASLPEAARNPDHDQLKQDLAAVKPHLDRIIQNGEFVRGHQSRIAECLGVVNGGVTNRRRIKKIEKVLVKKFLDQAA